MYRLLVESLLGLERQGDTLVINPHLACGWEHATIHYRYQETIYHIRVQQPGHGVGAEGSDQKITLDGVELTEPFISLANDQRDHTVTVVLASSAIGKVVPDVSLLT